MADIRIAVFNVETGIIQRIVKLNMAAPNQAAEGEDEIELPGDWEGDDTTHHVFDGELVKNEPADT